MIPQPTSTRIFLACGVTDMRKGFDGLTVLVQDGLRKKSHSGALFAFRGERGDPIKLLWFDGQGLCLFSKRMDRGRFVWPLTATDAVTLSSAQASMLLEGIDWRRAERTLAATLVG
ncbi:IS66 family insertion sequence element accessory protein TnpB [Sphingomonas montana]|uniref:IS66 family insertion sequence element accessory protein TnpB n=1 Tax=Sphingomonas montana TaxID=1843236 RepID=UPI00096E3F02|nr:IS66 family insertion sequence element accessory protein TnpB [Sphingomonas montana]